jgi:hypothetical protein
VFHWARKADKRKRKKDKKTVGLEDGKWSDLETNTSQQ